MLSWKYLNSLILYFNRCSNSFSLLSSFAFRTVFAAPSVPFELSSLVFSELLGCLGHHCILTWLRSECIVISEGWHPLKIINTVFFPFFYLWMDVTKSWTVLNPVVDISHVMGHSNDVIPSFWQYLSDPEYSDSCWHQRDNKLISAPLRTEA